MRSTSTASDMPSFACHDAYPVFSAIEGWKFPPNFDYKGFARDLLKPRDDPKEEAKRIATLINIDKWHKLSSDILTMATDDKTKSLSPLTFSDNDIFDINNLFACGAVPAMHKPVCIWDYSAAYQDFVRNICKPSNDPTEDAERIATLANENFVSHLLKPHDDPEEEAKRITTLASIGKWHKLCDLILTVISKAMRKSLPPQTFCDDDIICTPNPISCYAIEKLHQLHPGCNDLSYRLYKNFASDLLKPHNDPSEEAKRIATLASIGKWHKLPDDMLSSAAHQVVKATSEHIATNQFLATILATKDLPNVVLYLLKNMPPDVQSVIRTSILQFLTREGFIDFLKRLTLAHVEQALTKGFTDNNEPLNRLRAQRHLAMAINHSMNPASTPPKPSKHLTPHEIKLIHRQADQTLPLVCALSDIKHQIADTTEMATVDAANREHKLWAINTIADNLVTQWMGSPHTDAISTAMKLFPTDKDKEGKSEDNIAIVTGNAERALRDAIKNATETAQFTEKLLKTPGTILHSQAKTTLATLTPDGDLDQFIKTIVARLRTYTAF